MQIKKIGESLNQLIFRWRRKWKSGIIKKISGFRLDEYSALAELK